MSEQAVGSKLRGKQILAGALAVLAVVLFLLHASGPTPDHRAIVYKGDLNDITIIVDTVLARYGIDKRSVKTWQVRTPGKKFLRVGRRVEVPEDFVSVSFNQELNEKLSANGLHLVATERTRENTVTMHIKKDDTILHSMTFVVVPKQGTQGTK